MPTTLPRTDFLQMPNGLYVPPGFKKALIEEDEQRQRVLDRRFFAMSDASTGKMMSPYGQTAASTAAGAMDKPRDTTPYRELQARYDKSVIDRVIILARQHQMKTVSRRCLTPDKGVGWQVQHVRSDDPNFENTESIQARCREAEEAIERVSSQMFSGGLPAFLLTMVRDQLVFDRKVMVHAWSNQEKLLSYWTLDPTTVKPRIEVLAPWLLVNPTLGEQGAAEFASYDLYNKGYRDVAGQPIDLATAAYVQEIEGRIVGAWTRDQMDVDTTLVENRTDALFYGRSIFEQSGEITDYITQTLEYNGGWFRSRVPEQLVFLGGDVDPDGLDEFQKRMYAGMQPGDFHRIAFVPGDPDFKVQAMPLRQSMRDMAFPAWIRLLIAIKCAAYRMDPRIINFDVATGNDQQLWKSSSREMQLTLSQEEGFHTIIMDLENWFNRVIVKRMYPDLVLRWVGLDRPSAVDQIAVRLQSLQYKSVNEVRAETGVLHPIEVPGYPGVGDIPLSVLQAMQLQDSQRQQTMQEQAMQGQPATPGDALRSAQPLRRSFSVTLDE